MKVAAFYSEVRAKVTQLGGEDGTALWFHPDDWDNLCDSMGPPLHIRKAERDAWFAAAGHPWSAWPDRRDGADVGRFQFCPCRIHSDIPVGTVQIRRGDQQLEMPVGPFPLAVEPEGGWGKPLYMPPTQAS